MQDVDMSKPVEIEKDIYWVGSSEEALLRRNIYLRVFRFNGKNISMIIDPGPESDLGILAKKTAAVIGSLSKVNMIFVNHQDPDVAPNAKHIQKYNPEALTLMTEDTWRLVQFFGLNPEKFRAVEKFRDMKVNIRMASDVRPSYQMRFVPTPFCHFRGSCMYYDVDSRILFSGDFFGGISTSELFAEEEHWEGVKAFHQLYFPSRKALRHSLAKIKALDPRPMMIAPQHGGILKGEMIDLFIERMEKLMVGLDIIQDKRVDLSLVIDAANEIARVAVQEIGATNMEKVFEIFHPDGSYPAIFTLGSNNIIRDIKGGPMEAIEALVQVIFSFSDEEQEDKLKSHFLDCLDERGLTTLALAFD